MHLALTELAHVAAKKHGIKFTIVMDIIATAIPIVARYIRTPMEVDPVEPPQEGIV